tara:strand:- start:1444 stop:1680 length:237 start_codon:yes stop_codon:yes gene_type:complete
MNNPRQKKIEENIGILGKSELQTKLFQSGVSTRYLIKLLSVETQIHFTPQEINTALDQRLVNFIQNKAESLISNSKKA